MFRRPPTPLRFAYQPWSFGLEIFMSVGILCICMTVGLDYYRPAIVQAHLSGLYTDTSRLRTDLIVEHALTGRWPELTLEGVGLEGTKTPIEHLSLNDGHFNLAIRVRGVDSGAGDGLSNLSFRRVVNPEHGTVFWLCGSAEPRSGWQLPIPNITDIPRPYLPPNCR